MLKVQERLGHSPIQITYFLENDKWHIDFFGNIEQFKEQVERTG